MSKNISDLSFRKGIVDNLFDRMGKGEDLDQLAQEFLIGKANTYGAASFYDFLKPENKNKKVYICNGSACVCAGTQEAVMDSLSSVFEPAEIGHMTCLGRCHENGAFHYDGKNYSAKSKNDIVDILQGKKGTHTIDQYKVGGTHSLFSEMENGISEMEKRIKLMLQTNSETLLTQINTSQIRGRGGAGFPMAFKLESCKNTASDIKFIICNADEGDPGAYSDRYLLEKQPFAVLYGMIVAGYITGASWGVLYIRAEYPEAVESIKTAIAMLRENNLLGADINTSGFNFDFKIIQAQGAYICGEETALINSIEGQRPEVRTRPPYPTQQGLFGKPTIVNNVETLAAVWHIIDMGGSEYAKLGAERSKGTKLVCLDSHFNNPGVYEIIFGTPLSTVIETYGGGFKTPIKAMQIGGPLGGIVPISKIKDLSLDFESFANEGFLMGHASIVCIPSDFPMIDYLEHLMDFAQYESCGKCFPCRLGTKRAHELLVKAKDGSYKINSALFDDLLTTLQQGSLCAHGGGIPLPVRNVLQYFGEELKAYFED
ncbi:MAG: NADH-ubiquinone oxidoreductase-F iron-sulfur binding region domain-containing protein [Saprospiraceae bacterium]